MRLLFLLLWIVLICVFLAGCSTLPPIPTSSASPVCVALIGPIKTNTTKPESKRYLPKASTLLRADIKRRNQVGSNLRCPAYK